MSLNETCSEGSTVQYLSAAYRTEFCLEQEDVSEIFCFQCAFVYAFREVPAN